MTDIDYSLKGKRIRLIKKLNDPYTEMLPGAEGTIQFILRQTDQSICEDQISIAWDSGSSLMLLEGIDKYEVLEN